MDCMGKENRDHEILCLSCYPELIKDNKKPGCNLCYTDLPEIIEIRICEKHREVQ